MHQMIKGCKCIKDVIPAVVDVRKNHFTVVLVVTVAVVLTFQLKYHIQLKIMCHQKVNLQKNRGMREFGNRDNH